MKTKTLLVILLASLAATACARRKAAPAAAAAPRSVSTGDAAWLEDAASAGDTGIEIRLERAGFSSALIPAARLSRGESGWSVSREAPPRSPYASLPIALVVGADDSAASVLASDDEPARRALRDALAGAVRDAIAGGSRAGRVEAVLCDIPFDARSAEAYAEILRSLRHEVPRGVLLWSSLRFSPREIGDHERLRRLAIRLDGIVAMLWGIGDAADPAETDALGVPWWAGYAPAARGHVRHRGEPVPGPVPEEVFSEMIDDQDVEFRHDLTVPEPGFSYLLAPRRRVAAGGLRFGPGDVLRFRQPSFSELFSRIGKDASGRRFLRGRVLVLSGRPEAQSLFPLAAWKDLRAGRPLRPELKVSFEARPGALDVGAENTSPHVSAPSHTSNWIEIDLGSRILREVRPGGFDRYELYGANGRPVTPGRATRVRFYETLFQPFEKIATTRLLLRSSPPSGCCRYRAHLIAAAGQEITLDWRRAAPAASASTSR